MSEGIAKAGLAPASLAYEANKELLLYFALVVTR